MTFQLNIKTEADLAAEEREALKTKICAAIDAHIDAQAKALHYSSAAHLAGYTGSTVAEWAAEAQAFVAWRDACWLAALALLAQAEGSGDVPTVEGVLAQLPEWGE